MKGLLIHVGEYLRPAIIDDGEPEKHVLEYAKFSENGIVTRGSSHVDPEFEGFTYGDDPNNRAKRNLGKLNVGDCIFFMWTFLERNTREKVRYIPAYLRIKEISTVKDILQRSLGRSTPYCHNDHVKQALKGRREEMKFTIFVGDRGNSMHCKVPLRLGKSLVRELGLADSSGEKIVGQIDRKRDKNGRLMSEIEVINVYTRNPKLLDESQTQTLLKKIEEKHR